MTADGPREATRQGQPGGIIDGAIGHGQGHGHGLEADVPPGQHRAVPEGDRALAGAVAHRPPPAEHARERPGEVHRVRAVRVRVPRRRHLGEGADNDPEDPTSPGERYAKDYQINYLRCIMCGLCVEACPTRALTLTSYYELAFTTREEAIWTKEQLLEPPPELGTDPVDREGR